MWAASAVCFFPHLPGNKYGPQYVIRGISLADPAAGLPPTTAEHLPDDVATLKHMVLELLASLHERDRDNEALGHRISLLLLRRWYGPRGERPNPDQLLLLAEMAAGQDTAPAPTEPAVADKPKPRCRPHGRRLPDKLPREPRHHELAEAERGCPACGQVRLDIGADRSEQLDYRPASLIVIEHFVHKYVCPCCSRRPAPAPGQQPQPGPVSEPVPAEQAKAHLRPQPAAPSPPPPSTEPGQRPEGPAPRCRITDPGAMVIAAPKAAMPIAKGLPGRACWPT
jgi:hypothetical protein